MPSSEMYGKCHSRLPHPRLDIDYEDFCDLGYVQSSLSGFDVDCLVPKTCSLKE